ncbi:MAG: 50S ribosomal protein L13 [Nanoarchaeota archaeon]|nr:50S ribosomal protein L13 [Nanoarchaeota archaeon]
MDRIIIDAKDCIVGRMATQVAQLAKLGKEVVIINCEDAAITGGKKKVISDYLIKLHRGSTEKGPFYPKRPDRFVRRVIRGMMDYKGFKGKPAFSRVKTFIGAPKEYEAQVSKDFKCKKVSDLEKYKFVKISDVCKQLGGKW